jgi:putative DNA primase/helicase
LKLSGAGETSASIGNELLTDIQAVFERKAVTRITTADLLEALILDDTEAPWSTYNRGKPLSARQLSKMLGAYDVHSKTVRFGSSTPKGFELSQFADAFTRYLELPQCGDGPAEPQTSGAGRYGPADGLPADAF